MSAKRLRYFTVGRRVWMREGRRWLSAKVYSIHNGSLLVHVDGGDQREVAIHYSVLHRDLRVTQPKEEMA